MAGYYSKGFSPDAEPAMVDSTSIPDLLNDSRTNRMNLLEKYAKFLTEDLKTYLVKEIEKTTELDDWLHGDVPVTRESAQAFIELLKNLKPEVFPGLSCDYAGHAIMYWINGKNDAGFRCYSRNQVKWVV